MNNELMVLLGCGLAAYAVTNACTSLYENAEDSDSENEYEGFTCGSAYKEPEAYIGRVNEQFTQKNERYQAPADVISIPADATASHPNVSPLMFGTMVSEPYAASDYIEMKDFTANPDGIKVYNEKDDTIGLPVTDMTDVSAGENNKYIYDRTIGTIGFTSTKIGGRFRGQGDFIRGDLGIVPDKTGWFQVSSDPANKLVLGAMNVSNGIGTAPVKKKAPKEAGHAMRSAPDLDTLRQRKDKAGQAYAMGGPPPTELSALDVIEASVQQTKKDANSFGAPLINESSYVS